MFLDMKHIFWECMLSLSVEGRRGASIKKYFQSTWNFSCRNCFDNFNRYTIFIQRNKAIKQTENYLGEIAKLPQEIHQYL
jgi:hypothetical protein